MRKVGRHLWEGFGTLAGAVVGTYWLYTAPRDHSSIGLLKMSLSITLLAINYAIFFQKVSMAVLVHRLEIRQGREG